MNLPEVVIRLNVVIRPLFVFSGVSCLSADLVTSNEDKYYVLFLLTVCHHKGSKKIKECLSEVKKDCKSDPEVSITQQIIVRC